MKWMLFVILFLFFLFIAGVIFLPSMGFRITCFRWGSFFRRKKIDAQQKAEDYGFRLKGD